jgi:hypothetical protein
MSLMDLPQRELTQGGPGGRRTARLLSRTGGAEGSGDLLDGLGLVRADAAPLLAVCRRDLISEGEDEMPVAIDFFGGRLAVEQCDSASDVLQSVIPEFPGRVVSRVVYLRLRRDDLVEEFTFAVLGPRFHIGLRHRD